MKKTSLAYAFALLVMLGLKNGAAVTLDTVLRTTVDKNPEIQTAKWELEQAYGHRLVLRAIAYPDVSIGGNIGVQGGFTQPLFNAAIPASFRRATIEVLIAQQKLNMAMTERLHTARLNFYSG